MKYIMFSIQIIFFIGLLTQPALSKTKDQVNKFGGKITTANKTNMNQVMDQYKKFEGKVVSFEAIAKKVCEKKGCWMVLKDGDKQVRTLFKDYGFFVPKTIVGKKVRVQGTMKQKHVSAATIRHYMKDAGKKLEEIKKVKTGRIEFQFEADAVEII